MADLDLDKLEARLREPSGKLRATDADCDGSGHADAETECEYCGRPMQTIRALAAKPADTEGK